MWHSGRETRMNEDRATTVVDPNLEERRKPHMNPTPEPVEPASTEPDTGPDIQQEGDFQGEY
jgi:hypothetical protein